MTKIEIPNLDAMDNEELVEAENAFRNLAEYASWRRAAARERRKGYVARAVQFESIADLHYKRLPAWAKW